MRPGLACKAPRQRTHSRTLARRSSGTARMELAGRRQAWEGGAVRLGWRDLGRFWFVVFKLLRAGPARGKRAGVAGDCYTQSSLYIELTKLVQ